MCMIITVAVLAAVTLPGAALAADDARAQTHKIHHTMAATRQTEARKFLDSLS